VRSLGSKGSATGQFNFPRSVKAVTIGSEKHLIVADTGRACAAIQLECNDLTLCRQSSCANSPRRRWFVFACFWFERQQQRPLQQPFCSRSRPPRGYCCCGHRKPPRSSAALQRRRLPAHYWKPRKRKRSVRVAKGRCGRPQRAHHRHRRGKQSRTNFQINSQ
jgi:hypothetical protein